MASEASEWRWREVESGICFVKLDESDRVDLRDLRPKMAILAVNLGVPGGWIMDQKKADALGKFTNKPETASRRGRETMSFLTEAESDDDNDDQTGSDQATEVRI